MLVAIEATFEQLKCQPLTGVVWKPGIRRLPGLRMLPAQVYPTYLIFHLARAEFVRILDVVHSARDLPTVFNKDPRD